MEYVFVRCLCMCHPCRIFSTSSFALFSIYRTYYFYPIRFGFFFSPLFRIVCIPALFCSVRLRADLAWTFEFDLLHLESILVRCDSTLSYLQWMKFSDWTFDSSPQIVGCVIVITVHWWLIRHRHGCQSHGMGDKSVVQSEQPHMKNLSILGSVQITFHFYHGYRIVPCESNREKQKEMARRKNYS